MELLYLEIAKLVFEGKSDSPNYNTSEVVGITRKRGRNKSTKLDLDECDIRFIVSQGRTDKLSVDEALRKAGLVGEYDEFL